MNSTFRTGIKPALTAALVGFFSLGALAADASNSWPQWRGPLATGVAPDAKPPTEWSETKNVKWKVAIPGFGTSTPIIWENKVFILTAVPKKGESTGTSPTNDQPRDTQQFTILCLDRNSGKTIWEKVSRAEVPHESHHRDHGYASASPVTDGEIVLAYFGSRGLYAYDMEGKLKWETDFGDMRTRNSFGEGSTPAMAENVVVVLWDHEGEDFIVALDKKTGKELWRQKRDQPSGWSTPLIIKGTRTEVVVNGTNKVISYDLHTGKELWSAGGQTVNTIPTPVTDGEKVYVTSGFRGSALQAIKLGGTGDLTGSDAIAWSHNKNTPYVPSPLLYDNFLYFISGNNSVVSCWDTKTGKPLIDAERLETVRGGIYASPVGANDLVYLLGREGTTVVTKKGPKLDIVATNTLEDRTDASIAIVGNELFIRGHKNLYCIAAK